MAYPKWIVPPVLAAALLVPIAAAAQTPSPAALGDKYAAAGSFKAAGDAYMQAYSSTGDPTFLKKAGKEYLQLGSAGKADAIKAFSSYVRAARTLDEATEGEKLLKQAQALPDAAPVAPAPAPTAPPPRTAPAPVAPAPTAPAPAPAPAPARTAPAPGPRAPAPAPAPAAPAPSAGAAATAPAAGAKAGAAGGAAASSAPSTPAGKALGKQGRLVISAERLTSLNFWKERFVASQNGQDSQITNSGTDLGLLFAPAASSQVIQVGGGGAGGGFAPELYRVSSVPRLAVDYFVANAFSIGGMLGYVSRNGSTENKPAGGKTTTDDMPSHGLIVVGARGGYAHPFSSALNLWLLGGLSYVSQSWKQQQDELSTNSFYINVKADLAIRLAGSAYLLAGGYLDGTLAGSVSETSGGQKVTGVDMSYGEVTFGLTAGLAVGL